MNIFEKYMPISPKDWIDLTESEKQDSTSASGESSSEESDTTHCRSRSTGPKPWKIKHGVRSDDERSEGEREDEGEERSDGDERSEDDGDERSESEDERGEGDGDERSECEEERSEDESEEDEERDRWVCVVYDQEYIESTGDKHIFTGKVVEVEKKRVKIDFGEEEGIHTFVAAHSCDFTKNTYMDKFGWFVRIHDIHYDYKRLQLVDDTYNENREKQLIIPSTLQMPTLSVMGYILFITLIAPAFHVMFKTNDNYRDYECGY